MKLAISAAFALCAMALDVNTDDLKLNLGPEKEALPHRIIKSVMDHEFFRVSREDQYQSTAYYNVAPCQYWYDNSWYNLIGTGGFSALQVF